MADLSVKSGFIPTSSEMGRLIAAKDWSATPLGPVETWSQNLRTALGICLDARTPIGVYWGGQLVLLYNDAFRQLIGDKHPQALGRPAHEVFPEIWDTIGPMLSGVLATGSASGSESELLQLIIGGAPEEHWFDFSFNPIAGESGQVEGIFNIAVETTGRVRAERARLESERRLKEAVRAGGLSSDFRALFEAAPIPLVVLAPPDWTIVATNDARVQVTGVPREDVIGRKLFEAFPDDPDDPRATGVQNLTASLERVVATKSDDVMAVQRYPVRDESGRFVERWWSPMNTPVLGQGGEVALVIHRVEEVTDLVRLRGEAEAHDQLARDQQVVIDRLRATDAALRADRELLAQVFEQAPTFMGILRGPEHRFERVNPGLVKLIGGRDVVGRTVAEAQPEADEQGFVERLDKVYRTGRPFVAERARYAMQVTPGGPIDERIINVVFQPIRDASAQVSGIFVEGTDVTESAMATAALYEADERYRMLMSSIDVGYCVIELIFEGERAVDYRFVEVNPAFERQSGLVDAVGRTARELLPDLEPHWFELYGRVARTGEAERVEKSYERTGHWYEVYVLRLPGGQSRRVAVLFTDISARKQAELRLRELNETLEARVAETVAERQVLADIVESSSAATVALDVDYNILAINSANVAATERVYGIRPKVGDNLFDLLAHMPQQKAELTAIWSRALAGEEFVLTETFGDAAHERIAFEVRFNILRDRDGHQIGAFCTAFDVSDRVRAQAELEVAQEALRQSQKMEAVGQLTGGVAHDFNNLLTIIRSSAGLLRRPGLSDERRRVYMDAITDTVDRAARLTGQLLAFARRQTLKPEVFDAAERVRGLEDMLCTILGGRIEIVTDIACDPCLIKADVSQFETALVNMAVNARDAMDGEGTLTVRVESVTDRRAGQRQTSRSRHLIAISLTDTGSGIPPEHLERIFEPFFTTKEVGKGTGLGLSQVFGFAKQSGGDVGVRSEVGSGTSVTLYLPHAEGATITPTDTVAESGLIEEGGGRRVLVVEDNVEVGTVSTQVLSDLGYETTWVVNAQEALTYLHAEGGRFDVVFTDVVMPGMSGVELGEEIRRRYPGLPVVLISGYSDVLANEGQHGFELLKKPYAAEDLSSVLRRVSSHRGA